MKAANIYVYSRLNSAVQPLIGLGTGREIVGWLWVSTTPYPSVEEEKSIPVSVLVSGCGIYLFFSISALQFVAQQT